MAHRARSAFIACALALITTACGSAGSGSEKVAPAAVPTLHGSVPNGQIARPELSLLDTAGHPYDFQARTEGRVTLLYAGYTHCPDECPTTMATIAVALRSLSPTVADRVTVVFVTVDPQRDSAHVIRAWLDGFHPPTPYVGLRGTAPRIARAQVALGMPPSARKPAPKSYKSGAYAVDHFDGLLAYGRDDRLETIYPSTVRPTTLAADLNALVGS